MPKGYRNEWEKTMSKIKKGVRLLLTQGPVAVLVKLRNKRIEHLREAAFREKAKKVHLITEEQREYQKKYTFEEPIKFSIITPLYNTPREYLLELLHSVQRQTYSDWQLCLADGSDGAHAYVGKICREYAGRDARIVYTALPENKGISENTNACIALADGQYLGLLDHDDVLHESALFEMRRAIQKFHADFLYSDEVKFSGRIEDATDFNFKPGFGKDELRSHNYICHFTVFSRKLLERVNEAAPSGHLVFSKVYRPEFDGSQDHDMVLRLTEKAEKVIHVPKVLYYWRVHPESVSMNLDSKSYAVDAAIRAVQEQLERVGEPGKVSSNLPYRTIYRVRYEIDPCARVAIVVHHLDSEKEFAEYKEKVRKATDYPHLEWVPVFGENGRNLGSLLNQAARNTEAEYLVILDAKCMPLTAGWIEEMLMFAGRRDVAAVAPKILFPDHTIAYAGIALAKEREEKIRFLCRGIPNTEQGYEAILRYVRNTTAVWKGCFMVERQKLLSIGGFSEEMPGYEEIDFSLRAAEQGYRHVWTCFAEVEYQKAQIEDFKTEGRESFSRQWETILAKEDPYDHKNWKRFKLV